MAEPSPPDLPAPRPSAPVRRFSDAEVATILARASAREAGAGMSAPSDPTVEDLMAAAAEAGLDPAEVRRAASLVMPAGAGLARIALGAADHRDAVIVLDDAPFPTDTDRLVREAERATGSRGEVVEASAGRFVWRERHTGGGTEITLTKSGGGLELRARADRAGHYGALWFGGLVTWALLSALTPLGALPLLGKALGFLVAPVLLARPFWVAADRRSAARLERLALDLARVAEEEHSGS